MRHNQSKRNSAWRGPTHRRNSSKAQWSLAKLNLGVTNIVWRTLQIGILLFSSSLLPWVARADSPSVNVEKPSVPTDGELAALWNELTRADEEGTKKAFQIIRRMVQNPTQVVPFLQTNLKPAAAPEARRVDAWIDDLNSNDFSTREKAYAELEKLGALVTPAAKKKLAGQLPSLEVRRRLERMVDKVESHTLTGEELRALRAMEILEAIATPQAKGLIARLAQGAAGAVLTEDAKRAQTRLTRVGTLETPKSSSGR